MSQTFVDKNEKNKLMKQNDSSEIYKNVFFWKEKIEYNKIIMSTKNNLIIVIVSVKYHGAQIWFRGLHPS